MKKEIVDIYGLADQDGSYSQKNAYLLIKTLLGVKGANQISKRFFGLFFQNHETYVLCFVFKPPFTSVEDVRDFFERFNIRVLNDKYNRERCQIKQTKHLINTLEQQLRKKEKEARLFREEALEKIQKWIENL